MDNQIEIINKRLKEENNLLKKRLKTTRGALELICSTGFEMLDVEDARAVAKSSLKWLGDGNE